MNSDRLPKKIYSIQKNTWYIVSLYLFKYTFMNLINDVLRNLSNQLYHVVF